MNTLYVFQMKLDIKTNPLVQIIVDDLFFGNKWIVNINDVFVCFNKYFEQPN